MIEYYLEECYMSKKIINVVAAAIEKDGKIFCAQRPEGKSLCGNLDLLEHQDSVWLEPSRLKTLNWAPVDRPAVELLSK